MVDIKGYEGLYAITEDGQVWSYRAKKFMKPNQTRGYLKVKLSNKEIRKDYYIHRLVAEAYIPNPQNKPQVNHKDENKLNNNVDNLEWMTAKENTNYGTHNERVAISKSRPVYCVELDTVFAGCGIAAKELGLRRNKIWDCCNGNAKTHGNYHWCYAE